MTDYDKETTVKYFFLAVLLGVLVAGMIQSSIMWLILGSEVEIIITCVLLITISCGFMMVFIVYLVYYFKTYTIITRKKLKQLKKKE